MSHADRIAARLGWGQKEDFLLNVGSQEQQVHDLADACAADVAQAGQCGVVTDGAGADLRFELDGQGEKAGQARHSACREAWLATDRLWR